MIDYFPLVKGAVRVYELKDSSGTVRHSIEVRDLAAHGAVTTAMCRRTVKRRGKPATTADFTVTKDRKGVREGESVEFNYPIKVGTEWISPPRRIWIEALDAEVSTRAGKFKDCLRVAYLIAEGDGGSGERLYAPGVGLVKIVENDEAEPFTYELVEARLDE